MSDLSALGAEVGRLAHEAKMDALKLDAIVSPSRVPNVAAQTAAIASWQARQGAPPIAASAGWRDAFAGRLVPAAPASAAAQPPQLTPLQVRDEQERVAHAASLRESLERDAANRRTQMAALFEGVPRRPTTNGASNE
jgi:hypothetical protein